MYRYYEISHRFRVKELFVEGDDRADGLENEVKALIGGQFHQGNQGRHHFSRMNLHHASINEAAKAIVKPSMLRFAKSETYFFTVLTADIVTGVELTGVVMTCIAAAKYCLDMSPGNKKVY